MGIDSSAIIVWLTFRKGRHPAPLNLADCLSYAGAKGVLLVSKEMKMHRGRPGGTLIVTKLEVRNEH